MFSFDIEKTLKTGIGILCGMGVLSVVLVTIFEAGTTAPVAAFGKPPALSQGTKPLEIPFHLPMTEMALPVPNIEGDLCFSFDRARPDSPSSDSATFLVRLKKTNQIRRVSIPARIDFKYEKELQFSECKSSFWAELNMDGPQQIGVRLFIAKAPDFLEEIGFFQFTPEEAQVTLSSAFAEGSALRILAEGHLLGKDVFLKSYGEGSSLQRLEIAGTEAMAIREGDLLAWKGEKWCKIGSPMEGQNLPLTRVCKVDEKTVLFEAWGLDGYSRIAISSCTQIPFKTKSDEFLSSVRIRSEKQISCMLDKQCFVLRVGDWVLKEDNRWKILRKREEKDAYLQGKLEGELFVFDRIDLKGGQKNLQGNLVNLGRSQMLPINVVAHSQRKTVPVKEIAQQKKGVK